MIGQDFAELHRGLKTVESAETMIDLVDHLRYRQDLARNEIDPLQAALQARVDKRSADPTLRAAALIGMLHLLRGDASRRDRLMASLVEIRRNDGPVLRYQAALVAGRVRGQNSRARSPKIAEECDAVLRRLRDTPTPLVRATAWHELALNSLHDAFEASDTSFVAMCLKSARAGFCEVYHEHPAAALWAMLAGGILRFYENDHRPDGQTPAPVPTPPALATGNIEPAVDHRLDRFWSRAQAEEAAAWAGFQARCREISARPLPLQAPAETAAFFEATALAAYCGHRHLEPMALNPDNQPDIDRARIDRQDALLHDLDIIDRRQVSGAMPAAEAAAAKAELITALRHCLLRLPAPAPAPAPPEIST